GLPDADTVPRLALTATALPIIIHILNRRRQRRIAFSSLEFIFEMSKRRMRKVNLRRWLILLLRTLAVLLVVLAFARPTIRGRAALFIPAEAARNVIVCIDVSASMGAERETGTAFTVARTLAGQVVDESGKNDLLNVISFSSRADALFDAGTRNKQIVKNVIAGLQVTNETTSIARAVKAAEALVDASEIDGGEIYVISDFREPADSVLAAGVADNVRVVFLPVYEEAVDNVSIDRVFIPRKLIRPGEVVRVGVSLTNHSRENTANFPVELYVGDTRKAEKLVTLPAASSATVAFPVSINRWGAHRCRVAKNRDRLPVDDDRFFLLEVSRKIPVALIRGRKFSDDGKQAAAYFYVEKALNPRGSGEGEFSVSAVDEKDVTAASLYGKGVVVWTDPQQPDRRRLDLIKRYVEGGGAALVFLGHGRNGLWRDGDFLRYVGVEKATPREHGGGQRFTSFEPGHPVFSLFNEEELELLAMSRIRSYLAVSGVAPDSVLAYLGSGDPGIWECRRGEGRIVVVAATPDMPSGDLPLSPMFLPLIHTSVSYLASTEAAGFHQENYAGADLVFAFPAGGWNVQGSALRVISGTGFEDKPLLYELPHGDVRAMVTRPPAVGFYRLLADTTQIAQAVVNVDTRESNLNPIEFDKDVLGSGRLVDTTTDFAENLRREKQGREIYTLFLFLALSALVAEAILGRKA
ncbi:MAG: BatA domain-containing protein, partial [Candidatus Krumholzibacteriia bacterium]